METQKPRGIIAVAYEAAAQDYLRSLPPEHFMEATAQAKQREITLASLALVKADRPDVHVFNELLVQYPLPNQKKPGQVVPDNMVVVSDKPIRAETSFNTPLEPEGPFWMLEYVSKFNKRKDYEESFDKYEHHLKVPYYLTFYPDDQELTLYKHNGKKFLTVKPNDAGRYAVDELKIEVQLQDGWVRFWYRGELLPLPAELLGELEDVKRHLREEKRRTKAAEKRAEAEQQRADEEKQRADELRRGLEEAQRELALLRSRIQPSASRQTKQSRSPE